MNALVTGATGFIGLSLVKELVGEKQTYERALVLPDEDVSLGLHPPLTRFSVHIEGRDYDVDTALMRRQLGWKTKAQCEEAMERIGEWVKEVYSNP